MSSHLRFVLSALFPTLAFCSFAAAQSRPSARFAYTRSSGAEHCPDDTSLRDAVSARLGYDPFDSAASNVVEAAIRRNNRGLRALIQVRDSSSRILGSREIDSDSNDCGELASSVSLAIAIAVDPLVLNRAASASVSSSTSAVPALAPLPSPPASSSPSVSKLPVSIPENPKSLAPVYPPVAPEAPSEPAQFRAGVGGTSLFGIAPATALGLAIFVGSKGKNFSVALEGRLHLPASHVDSDGVGARSSLIAAGLVPCSHYRSFFGCAVLLAGAMQGTGLGVNEPAKDSTFYAASGARLGAELPLSDTLSLMPYGDFMGTLTRTSLKVGNNEAWSTPVLWGSLGVSVVGTIP